jgi:hypothetical protein
MRISALVVIGVFGAFALAVSPALGAGLQERPQPKAGEPTPKEEVHQGELETFVAIGGESTGWRLRVHTPQGRRFIEVRLTPAQMRSVKQNVPVVIRGTFETRHYVERGDVQVLVAKEVLEVARR